MDIKILLKYISDHTYFSLYSNRSLTKLVLAIPWGIWPSFVSWVNSVLSAGMTRLEYGFTR